MDNANFQVCDRDLSDERVDLYLQADAIAIDTETMGLLPQRDRLCLVQLCNPAGDVTAIRIERGQAEAPNLKRLLETQTLTKIFHYARFDVATLRFHLGIETTPIFCTKVASKLARTYTPRHGLKDVVKELTGVELDKSAQSSDWGNPDNLTSDQLAYAANDVRYLFEVRDKLTAMLKREDRWDLAQECFQCIPVFAKLDLMQYGSVFEHH